MQRRTLRERLLHRFSSEQPLAAEQQRRPGSQIALQLLGTSIGFGISGEGGSVSFRALKDKFAPTLAVMVEEMLTPAFPEAALDRLRQRTLVNLKQNLDRTAGIASVVYPKLLYTTDHPYGRTMSEASVASTRAAENRPFEPNRSTTRWARPSSMSANTTCS